MWISWILLTQTVKINWFNNGKYFSTDESVKINLFNNGKYCFHWWISVNAKNSISENLTDSDLESESIKFHWLPQWKLTDSTVSNIFSLANQRKWTGLIVKYIIFTGESAKKQVIDSISENLTNPDLESVP